MYVVVTRLQKKQIFSRSTRDYQLIHHFISSYSSHLDEIRTFLVLFSFGNTCMSNQPDLIISLI